MDVGARSFLPRLNLGPQLSSQAPHAAEHLKKRDSTQFRANVLRSRASSGSEASLRKFQQPRPESLLSLTRSRLDALGQQHTEGEFTMAFESSTSGTESSTQSSHDGVHFPGLRVGLGIGVDEKPLPSIPSSHALTRSRKINSEFDDIVYPQFDTNEGSLGQSTRLGFSFKPGDDADILTQDTSDDLNLKDMTSVRIYQQRTTFSREQSESSNTSDRWADGAHLKSKPFAHKLKPQSSRSRDSQDRQSLARDDSTSSIITAVRDNSGRSSIDSSKQSSQGMRQSLNRSSSSSEAVTAAVRAFASASASNRNSSRKGSSTGTREGSLKGDDSPRIDEVDKLPNEQNQRTDPGRSET